MKLTKWMGCILTLALLLALGGGFFLIWGLREINRTGWSGQTAIVYVPAPSLSSQARVAADFSELGEWMAHIPTYEGYAGIFFNYKKPSLPGTEGAGLTGYPSYSSKVLSIHDFVMGILCAVPLYPAEDTGFPDNYSYIPAESELLQIFIQTGKEFPNLFIWQKTPDEPTIFILERDFGAERQTYVSEEPVMDVIREMVRPYTLDAAKTASDKFVAALAQKDLGTLESLANPYDVLVNEWGFLHSPTKITEVQKEIVREAETYGIYRVSFQLEGEDCAPFSPGYNERILEVDYARESMEIYAASLIEEGKFINPDNAAEKAVVDFFNMGTTQPFADSAALSVEVSLGYILYRTPVPAEGTFTQEEMDRAMQKYFGIASVNPQESEYYYNETIGRYEPLGRCFTPVNARIIGSQFQEDGSCTVTAEFYRDGLQTLVEKRMVYSLQKNPDETYRFVRAELID